jgi:hypothetical protein
MRSNMPIAVLIIIILSSAIVFGSAPQTTSLFDLAQPFSIAGNGTVVSISGRVKMSNGRPIKSAVIVLKDPDTGEVVRSTLSSSFGYYRLDQVESGRTYVLSVSHKRYLFVFPAQLLEINEDRAGLDFTGEASE